MRNLKKLLENKLINDEKLIKYGFIKESGKYYYETKICDDNFKVIVEMTEERQESKVIDIAMGEEYILVDVQEAHGDFVGRVKEEYEEVLNDIISACSEQNTFKNEQAKMVIKYIKEVYGADLEYLWEKFPTNAIWRNKENNKWFGILMVVSMNKLGIDDDRKIEIIDLRYQKDAIEELIDHKYFFEGYHMNKKSWITIKLDGSVDIERIYELIDNSYELSLKK